MLTDSPPRKRNFAGFQESDRAKTVDLPHRLRRKVSGERCLHPVLGLDASSAGLCEECRGDGQARSGTLQARAVCSHNRRNQGSKS